MSALWYTKLQVFKKAAFKKFSLNSVYCFAIMIYKNKNKKNSKYLKKLMAT